MKRTWARLIVLSLLSWVPLSAAADAQMTAEERAVTKVDAWAEESRDLADKEAAEIKLIEAYLPKAAGEEEIRAGVRATIAARRQLSSILFS